MDNKPKRKIGDKLKTEKPALSVIMPTYNAERYLEKSIESVLGQTFENFEFIIIDDGSEDNSFQIAEKYAERDERIKLYKQMH